MRTETETESTGTEIGEDKWLDSLRTTCDEVETFLLKKRTRLLRTVF